MNRLKEMLPKIQQLEEIPTIPTIVQPLANLLQLPVEQLDIEKVVELVSYDSTIAAQCLRMANSPLFGRRKTETVRSAILALGLKRVQAILLGCCLNRIVPVGRWAFDAVTFWRHSLGCALVSRKMAGIIGYPDPEKAYLAGLVHDIGILVNTVICTEEYRICLRRACEERVSLHRIEERLLGFTHCQTGKILGERWKFSADVIAVIEGHHKVDAAQETGALVSLVHLSDLLCRLRDLGYGYYEVMGIDFTGEQAWVSLVKNFPSLAKMDLARLTMDIDGAMGEIVELVEAVFKPQPN
ncbi:MAG TPA: HDOD domain-containing protein [Candidatus Eisenbacteria bacterium]|nr:HDOD domain-containing protein [Candidatus Eisenbacteria bacterium]